MLCNERVWIKVDDRMPDKDGHYLVYCDNGQIHEASYSALRKAHWLDPVEEYEVYSVTHWMNMPEPPKEGDFI